MYIPMRRSLGLVLGVLVILGLPNAKSQAQYSSLGLGFNPYVNPLGGGGSSGLGYGSLLSSSSGEHGHDDELGEGLQNSAVSGAGYSYGYGLSNMQWMTNPYQGYLRGAADLSRAGAHYGQIIQQARMPRQESIRSSLQTRRATIEEAEWERAHMPDPEKIRQGILKRELAAARVRPPLRDIWSGRALNTLLRHLCTQRGDGARGPRVPIAEATAQYINVKGGSSAGNVALLKNKGELEWPESLQGSEFKASRQQLNALMHRAYKSVESGNNPTPATPNDLLAQFRKMSNTLQSNVSELTPDEYIEAQRYLSEIGQTIKGLQDPDVGHQFNGDWRPTKARNVAELVEHMRDKGLMFAPASRYDEAAYVALYHALSAFDAGVERVVHGTPDASDNR